MDQGTPRRCEQCGYEYEPWVEACPDCGAPLVEPAAPVRHLRAALEGDGDPHWTTVTSVPNAIIGSLIKSQLLDAGIPVLMYRSASADVGEFSHNDYVPHDLRVPRARWDEARSLIDSRPNLQDSIDMASADYPLDTGEEDAFPRYQEDPRIPDGWTLLPGASDMQQRDQLTRGRNDASLSSRVYRVDAYDLEPIERDEYTLNSGDRRWERERFSEDDYSDAGRQKWVRIFYGILLLALTLPFLAQALGQIARIFGN